MMMSRRNFAALAAVTPAVLAPIVAPAASPSEFAAQWDTISEIRSGTDWKNTSDEEIERLSERSYEGMMTILGTVARTANDLAVQMACAEMLFSDNSVSEDETARIFRVMQSGLRIVASNTSLHLPPKH